MQAAFSDLKQFTRLDNSRALLDLGLHWGAILALFVTAHLCGSVPVYIGAALLIAGLQHGLINLQHEAWHVLCFKSKTLNDTIGAWFYGYPVGMPYYLERYRHLEHHKMFGGQDDPDWITYTNENRETPQKLYRFFAKRLFGSLLFDVLVAVVLKRKARVGAKSQTKRSGPSMFSEYARVAGCQVVLLAGFALAGRFWEYFVLWLIPLVTASAFFVTLRGFLEHAHVDDSVNPDDRLYDFHPNLFEKFFMSPADFNYHAVHHAYPTVPHFSLGKLHRCLQERKSPYPNKQLRGYFSYLAEHIRLISQAVAEQGASTCK